MATQERTTGLTYADLQGFPDDNLRREIIDGELFVTPAPGDRHQDVVTELITALHGYAKAHGEKAQPAPRDVFLSDRTVVEPDVLFVKQKHLDRAEERFVRGAPDLVVEVSSPSTRRTDQIRKRDAYERRGVPEYWFVDLDADRIEAYRLTEGRYGHPQLFGRGEILTTPLLPGLTILVDEALGPAR